MFQDKIENSVSYSIFKKAFHLPTFHDMTLDDQIRVVDLIKEYLGKK
jgi:dTDP-4-amino-4,6-dideoxygalactose transaminase